MSKYITNKIKTIVNAGTSFASDVESEKVDLTNYQSAKIVITTDAGTEAKTNASVIAILPDNTEKELATIEIAIGGTENVIDFVANKLAHYDATAFKVKIAGVAETKITGGVIVILGEERYSE
ncbi:MAG: hypothetical protein IJ371_04145 [Clostridia bacterium]|nr:hypothetical protein [Clostridia bacterium]